MPNKANAKTVNRKMGLVPKGRVKPGPPKDGRLKNNTGDRYKYWSPWLACSMPTVSAGWPGVLACATGTCCKRVVISNT